jgi:hypothetical protein
VRVLARVLAVLSCLVLAAHFLRQGLMLRAVGSPLGTLFLLLVLVSLALPLLLLVREAWGVRVLRAALAVASLEWIRFLVELAIRRREEGAPWMRAVLILSSVVVVTALASVLLRPPEAVTDRRSERS